MRMRLLKFLLSEIVGLFVDDALLALGTALVVAASAALAAAASATAAGAMLILGSLAVLVASVWRALPSRR